MANRYTEELFETYFVEQLLGVCKICNSRKYQTRTLSPVEEDYYQSLKQLKQATQEGK